MTLRQIMARLPIGRAAAFVIGNVAAQGLSAVAGLFIARWLSVEDYGLYTIVTVVMGIMAVLTMGGVHLGLTAILGRTWPNLERAYQAIQAALRIRRLLSLVMLPIVLGIAFAMLVTNGASYATGLLLIVLLVVYWWADLNTKLLDQILYFAKQTTRVQLLDTVLAMVRVVGVIVLYYLGFLDLFWAVALSALVAALKVGPVWRWVDRVLGTTPRRHPLDEDVHEVTTGVRDQFPVEIYYVIQSQILIVVLSIFGTVAEIAGMGAITRVHQLLLPIEGFVYAFCIPLFATTTTGIAYKYALIVALTSLPGVLLTVVAYLVPWALLWLVGPNYADLQFEVLVATAVGMVLRASLTAWQLVAHRGWTAFSWVQIPAGLASLAAIAMVVDLGSITGALLLTLSLAVGRIAAAAAELISASKRGALT